MGTSGRAVQCRRAHSRPGEGSGGDPRGGPGAAERALRAVDAAAGSFVVHCDVDVLSFVDVPLADVPDSGGDPVGLRAEELAASLAVFAGSPGFAGFVLTEINPEHAPEPGVLTDFLATVATALTGGR